MADKFKFDPMVFGVTWILAGLLSFVFAYVFGMLETTMAVIISGIILLIGLIMTAKYAGLDNKNWFTVLITLLSIAIVGSIVTTFAPQVSPYILSLTEFSLMGLGWTIFYWMLAEAVIKKL